MKPEAVEAKSELQVEFRSELLVPDDRMKVDLLLRSDLVKKESKGKALDGPFMFQPSPVVRRFGSGLKGPDPGSEQLK